MIDSGQAGSGAIGAGDTKHLRAPLAHRRKRTLRIHVGLYILVNAFMVGTWIMTKLAPGASLQQHRRPPAAFWPGWLIVTWGSVLGLHALYAWARRTGRAPTEGWTSDPRRRRIVSTVLFTDIVGSTELATTFGDQRWGELIERHDRRARDLVDRFGGRMVKTLGDGLLAIFEAPRDAILCAKALRDDLRAEGVEIRAGLHTGEVDLRQGDVGGIGVHIASRIMAEAERSEILTSRTVRDLVTGSEMAFQDRGLRELKGIQGNWQVFAVAETQMTKKVGSNDE